MSVNSYTVIANVNLLDFPTINIIFILYSVYILKAHKLLAESSVSAVVKTQTTGSATTRCIFVPNACYTLL